MNEPIKIEVKPQKLEEQRPTTITHCYLTLYETYLEYSVRFHAMEPKIPGDQQAGEEEIFNSFETLAKKIFVAGIEKAWMPKQKLWGLYIMVKGFGSDIRMHFKRESEAQDAYTKIKNWLLNVEQNNIQDAGEAL